MSSMKSTRNFWSKSYPVKPKHNLLPFPEGPKARFTPSYEKGGCPPYMSLILAMEYGRIWRCERDQLQKKRTHTDAVKVISPFKDWMKKHAAKSKSLITPCELVQMVPFVIGKPSMKTDSLCNFFNMQGHPQLPRSTEESP